MQAREGGLKILANEVARFHVPLDDPGAWPLGLTYDAGASGSTKRMMPHARDDNRVGNRRNQRARHPNSADRLVAIKPFPKPLGLVSRFGFSLQLVVVW